MCPFCVQMHVEGKVYEVHNPIPKRVKLIKSQQRNKQSVFRPHYLVLEGL